MNLTPRDKDKLLVSVAAMVAERRRRRGVRLNHPEAVALITDFVLEGARDGKSVAELTRDGATVIGREQVMEGVPEMIGEIQVEVGFTQSFVAGIDPAIHDLAADGPPVSGQIRHQHG